MSLPIEEPTPALPPAGDSVDGTIEDGVVQVRAGNPTADELAAVVAVLSAVAARPRQEPADAAGETAGEAGRSAWSRSQRSMRSWSRDATWN